MLCRDESSAHQTTRAEMQDLCSSLDDQMVALQVCPALERHWFCWILVDLYS